ncbi:MAG: hypothetical protein ACK4N5_27645, partial [Myxococcales bacterium]
KYTFNINRPPPPLAISDFSAMGGPKRAAIGMLVAYRDGNGNRVLDTIKADGVIHDEVLGGSMGFEDDSGSMIIYVDAPVPADSGLLGEVKQGFNLVQNGAVVPLETPIPIELKQNPLNNLLICEQLFSSEQFAENPCGIDPMPALYVGGSISLEDETARIGLFVGGREAGGEWVVTLDGVNIPAAPFDGSQAYELERPNQNLLRPGGTHTLTLTRPGEQSRSFAVQLPQRFDILSPAQGATVATGRSVHASWSKSEGARLYEVQLATDDGSHFAHESVEGTSATFQVPAISGPGHLRVSAAAMSRDPILSGLYATVSRTVLVTFAAQ